MTALFTRIRSARMQDAAMILFVLTEAFAWYVGLRAVGTMMARNGFSALLDGLQQGGGNAVLDPARLQTAIAVARDASLHASGGPSLVSVLLAAGGAYVLVRWLVSLRMGIALAAILGVAISLIAFQVLMRIAIDHDLRVWQSPGLVTLLGAGDASTAPEVDLGAFIAHPSATVQLREPLTATIGGLAFVWIRFLAAGRGKLTYERTLRSFGIGFAALLFVDACVGVAAGVDVVGLTLVYFVLGVLMLAVAHAARAEEGADAFRRTAPWLVSLAATLGLVAGVALLFGLLASINAQQLFQPVVGFAISTIGKLLWLVLYPFAVVMNWGMSLVLGGKTLKLDQMLQNLNNLTPPKSKQPTGSGIPGWFTTTVRATALIASTWLLYRLGRVLFAAQGRGRAEARYVEVRAAADAEPPTGGLLGGLFRRRPNSAASGEWLRRHLVYQLFARVVNDARTRGVSLGEGDTPLEFGHAAANQLDAAPFEPVARAFDRARYGRHFPQAGEVEHLADALDEWEGAHPPPEGAHPGG